MNKNSFKLVSRRIGYSNSVLIVNGSKSILVDTGVRGHAKDFRFLFKQHGLTPNDIKLIILTHAHYDHTGNLHKLKKLTGAKVLVHKNEFENLKNGFIPIPNGQGRYSGLISKLGKLITPKFASPRPFVADLINEEIFDLKDFGLDGKVISTPGHTTGSQSVLLGKNLIAGDTVVNFKNGKIFPPFCNEPVVLLQTWKKLLELEIEKIYPGHGKSLSREDIIPEFEKWSKRFAIKD